MRPVIISLAIAAAISALCWDNIASNRLEKERQVEMAKLSCSNSGNK